MRIAAVVIGLLLSTLQARGQGVPVFSSTAEVVRLDVAVMEDGFPVGGLRASDFEIRDEGVVQDVEIVGAEDKQIHAVLAFDTSGSLKGAPLASLKAAAHAIVEGLDPEDAVTLLTFSDRVELRAAPGETRERLQAIIESTEARLTTSLRDASFSALALASPDRGRPLVLIFSDGQDRGSWLTDTQVLDVARASDLVVHVVSTSTDEVPLPLLEGLTSITGGRIWTTRHENLREVLLRAVDEFRNRYTLQYVAQGSDRRGWRRIEARVRGHKGAVVAARKGYTRP